MADDVDLLLADLCAGWGYCNFSVSGEGLLAAGWGTVTAAAVAEATLAAEGGTDSAHRAAIERLFVYRYGKAAISDTEYGEATEPPYSVVPDLGDNAHSFDDRPLCVARALLSGIHPVDEISSLSLEEIISGIRRVRRRKGFALGEEEHRAAQRDLASLIVLHERLTGRYWNSDPEGRKRLGLGTEAGTLPRI